VNVCCYCVAWYCPKHIHHAMYAVAEQMALLSQPKLDWSSSGMEEAITEILNDAGFLWPDDEQELDVDDGYHDHTS
jgi:hypothetical protein